MEQLLMPKNSGSLPLVQWPLFLLASKVEQLLECRQFLVFPFFLMQNVIYAVNCHAIYLYIYAECADISCKRYSCGE